MPDTQKLPRTFGLKDLFTSLHIVAGVMAIVYCIDGNLRYAAYSFLFGFIFGDSLDGAVARLTKSGNRFGAEYDVIADHFVQCIVPGAMVFIAYRDLSFYLALALGTLVILAGSIRHARSAVAPSNFAMAYIGMPRTFASFTIISFLNAQLVPLLPYWRYIGIGLLVLLCAAQLLPIPFRSHKGRKFKWWVKYFVSAFFVMTIVTFALRPAWVFDLTLAWLIAYGATSWIEMEPEERRAFFVRAREWAAEIRAAR